MIKLIPYSTLKLRTRYSENDVLYKLGQILEPKNYFRYFWTLKFMEIEMKYEGSMQNNRFKMNRITPNNKSFVTVFEGMVNQRKSQTDVSITVRPSIATLVHLIIGTLLFSLFSIGYLMGMINVPVEPEFLVWVIPFMLYSIYMMYYNYEFYKSRNFLSQYLNAVVHE